MKIGFLADIHEDIIMLKRAISMMEKMQVDEIICLGDIVGYSIPFYNFLDERDANAVVDLLRSECSNIVIGNHDLFAVRKFPKNSSFFDYPLDWYQMDFQTRNEKALGKMYLYENNELATLLSSRNYEFLKSLPEYVVKQCEDHAILCSHYAFPDCTGCAIWTPSDPVELIDHFNFMQQEKCLYAFSGHDHVEGLVLFTPNEKYNSDFGSVSLLPKKTWINGPAVVRGTTYNGFMIYDSIHKQLTAHALGADRYILPSNL